MHHAAVDIRVQVFVLAYILLLWGVYLKVELLGFMVNLSLTINELDKLLSKVIGQAICDSSNFVIK